MKKIAIITDDNAGFTPQELKELGIYAIKMPVIVDGVTKYQNEQFSEEDLLKNFATLADAILRAKPSSAKGTFVRSVYLATTMGPGIKLDPKNLAAEVKEVIA